MSEIELKLLLSEEAARALRRAPVLRSLAQGRAKRRKLLSVYYDTPDHALRRAGIALRLRRIGRGWVQTVKHGRAASALGLHALSEHEAPAPGGRLDLGLIPDAALRAALERVLEDAPLSPIFETLIDRTTWNLVSELGSAELALDEGEVVAGGERAGIREAELELLEGSPIVLYAMARALFADIPARFSDRSKAARGFALALGEPASPAAATRRAGGVAPKRGRTTEAAAADILRDCMAMADANAAVCLERDDPEGPHQLRVGLRRLRSALKLFSPALDGPAAEALNAEARTLAARAGALRDLDVLIEEMLAPAAAERREAGEPDAGLEALAAACETRRSAARTRLRTTLGKAPARRFMLDLSAFIELRGWLRPADHAQTAQLARPVEKTAAAALAKRWRKARKAARGLEELDVEARHELRKELKKLRYGVDYFGPLWPEEKVKPWLKTLKRLQKVFGAMNDAAMAKVLLTARNAPCADDPAAQMAVGRLLGRLEAQAEADWLRARELWDALEDAKPFWK